MQGTGQDNAPANIYRTATIAWLNGFANAIDFHYFVRVTFPETTNDFHQARKILNVFFRELQRAPAIQQGILTIGILKRGQERIHGHFLVSLANQTQVLLTAGKFLQHQNRQQKQLDTFQNWWKPNPKIAEVFATPVDNPETATGYMASARNHSLHQVNGLSRSEWYAFNRKRIMSRLAKITNMEGSTDWWRERAERALQPDRLEDPNQSSIQSPQSPVPPHLTRQFRPWFDMPRP